MTSNQKGLRYKVAVVLEDQMTRSKGRAVLQIEPDSYAARFS